MLVSKNDCVQLDLVMFTCNSNSISAKTEWNICYTTVVHLPRMSHKPVKFVELSTERRCAETDLLLDVYSQSNVKGLVSTTKPTPRFSASAWNSIWSCFSCALYGHGNTKGTRKRSIWRQERSFSIVSLNRALLFVLAILPSVPKPTTQLVFLLF